ncbi:MAG: hypothetical protein KME26_09175 [Oscillatoria princeps RMCB-10]|jgi:hypothetical protein|nr:hypothetical protein [Oscillatoria princeps RMCB-10]
MISGNAPAATAIYLSYTGQLGLPYNWTGLACDRTAASHSSREEMLCLYYTKALLPVPTLPLNSQAKHLKNPLQALDMQQNLCYLKRLADL